MRDNSYEKNLLVFDAFPTEDNGFIVFAVQGNVQNVFERVNRIGVMKIDNKGILKWTKRFSDLTYGFPSNIIRVDNDNFHLFWSEEGKIKKLAFQTNDTDTMSMEKTVITCDFIDDDYTCDKAYKIASDVGKDPYIYMNTFNKNTLDDPDGFITLIVSSEANTSSFTQYGCDPASIFPNIDQYNPATKFERNFWLRTYKGKRYVNTPYEKGFALLEVGNETPIYSDETHWIGDFYFTNNNTIATIITPQNDRTEEGRVYFVPSISLDQINQNFSSISKDLKVDLPNIDTDYKITIQYLEEKQLFAIAATTLSGSAALYIIDEQGKILNEHFFGEINNYQVGALRLTSTKKDFALFGTTKVNGKYQRAYYIKIPVVEAL